MNERERFEEWAKEKGYNITCSDVGPDRIVNGLMFYDNIRIRDKQEGWQARVEIAKQDEKELIEAYIKLLISSINRRTLRYGMSHKEDCMSIKIIEKHTGKTWKELNE